MKLYYVGILLVIVIAAVAGATHFLYDAGQTACVATQATAQVHEDQKAQQDWLKGYNLDFTADTAYAKSWDSLSLKATTLEGADHALKARNPVPAPAASTLVPNPFPLGFGVCWRAAGTGDQHDTAACQAYAGHGAAGQASPDPQH